VRIDLDGRVLEASATLAGTTLTLDDGVEARRLVHVDPLAGAGIEEDGAGRFVAPMPGKIVAVRCEAGTRVARGQVLVVLEAMKMEHAMLAPADGRVEILRCRQGDQVAEGDELLVFHAEAP
jgi:3-methylcrotonyl-CoA carboxylase alpha subunit